MSELATHPCHELANSSRLADPGPSAPTNRNGARAAGANGRDLEKADKAGAARVPLSAYLPVTYDRCHFEFVTYLHVPRDIVRS